MSPLLFVQINGRIKAWSTIGGLKYAIFFPSKSNRRSYVLPKGVSAILN